MLSDYEWEAEVSPETYLVDIRTTKPIAGQRQLFKKHKLKSETKLTNDREARIQFPDEQAANRVADAIRQAASFCAITRLGS